MTVSHLVRRGVEAISTMNEGDIPEFKIEVGSPWLAGLLLATVIAFGYAIFSIEYTYGLLVPTLAAVEDSNPEFYVRVDSDPINKKSVDSTELEIEVETAPPRPITSKLRTTIRHLRARAGRWSRFRGFSMFLTILIGRSLLASLIPMSPSSLFGQFFIGMASDILLANLHVAWVHIAISEPSPKRFYKRIPAFGSLAKIVPAAAFENLLSNGAFYVSMLVIKQAHGLGELDSLRSGDNVSPQVFRNACNMVSISAFIGWLASIPARVIFVRVAASMLPDEDEAIIPFDRSYGGKVVPGIVGGGVLSISDAWKTFDRAGWKRYIKTIVKAIGLQFAVTTFFSLVLFAEILGGALVYKTGDKN
ncbi:hypothetical protein BDW59DRAFT_132041 [Aspergillus cavernicola]|uniref:OPT oligopeptide transporter protein-domain-containing protein n=1 Tax=Aspergillus cavernicola TaxID=176166 RepID=A0ABR4HPZ3_9EURO